MMKHFLNETERNILEHIIEESEQKTGAQIVVAVVGKCDHYPEIPWKAFSSGVVLSGLIVLIFSLLYPVWVTGNVILFSMATIFGAGIILAIATIIMPWFARIFLPSHRMETETLQYAESLFLNHEHFATGRRNGILMMVSLFERQVIILPDKGIASLTGTNVIGSVIEEMKEPLREHRVKEAIEKGLKRLASVLPAAAPDEAASTGLSNRIIEEEGV